MFSPESAPPVVDASPQAKKTGEWAPVQPNNDTEADRCVTIAAGSPLSSSIPGGTSPDDSESESDTDTAGHPRTSDQERVRVLQAAGLVVEQSSDRPVKRRPPPPRPRSLTASSTATDTPTTPIHPVGGESLSILQTDDAYAIWQKIQRDQEAVIAAQQGDFKPGVSHNGVREDPLEQISQTAAPRLEEAGSVGEIGKTWSSLIDPDALSTIPDKARRRQESIFELIKTEESFLDSMQLIVREWFAKLQPILDEKNATIIFGNVEEIMLWSATFLSDLEQRQRDCRLYVDKIGDIVRSHFTGLDVYRPYCVNQGNAAQTLAGVRQSDAQVNKLAETRLNGLTLEHFLLQPMQRLARYPLLIGQILRYTEEGDDDVTDLKLALRSAHQVLNRTNEQIRRQEVQEKLAYLSDNIVFVDDPSIRLDLTAQTRFVGTRDILKEGLLVKGYNHRRSSKRKELHTYLFNDLLLFTTRSVGLMDRLSGRVSTQSELIPVYRAPLPLDEISVQPGREDRVFSVRHQGEEFKLQAPTIKQAQDWVLAIEKARQHVLAEKSKLLE